MKKTKKKSTINILSTLPVELDQALRSDAEANQRSRNAQLVRILSERYGMNGAEKVNGSHASAEVGESRAAA